MALYKMYSLAVVILCVYAMIGKAEEKSYECFDASKNTTVEVCPLLFSVATTVEDRTDYINQLLKMKSKIELLEGKIVKLETQQPQKNIDMVEFCSSVQQLCSNGSQDLPSEKGGCGRPVIHAPPAVAVSKETVPGEWPWTVSLAFYVEEEDFYNVACNAVLIDRRTVLTTAQCVNGKRKRVLQFGIYYKSGTDRRHVELRTKYQILIHPKFDEVTNANNIALLKLDSDLEYTDRILPICLPTPQTTAVNLVPGNDGIVSGWQYTDEQTIRKSKIYVKSNEVCLNSIFETRARSKIGPDMFCTKWIAKWFWNGSPLVFYDEKTERYTLEGLTSHFLGHTNDGDLYEVFIKVSHFLDWIHKNRHEKE